MQFHNLMFFFFSFFQREYYVMAEKMNIQTMNAAARSKTEEKNNEITTPFSWTFKLSTQHNIFIWELSLNSIQESEKKTTIQ